MTVRTPAGSDPDLSDGIPSGNRSHSINATPIQRAPSRNARKERRFDSPGWALAFSRSLFQASLLPASVLQFLVLETRRSFSRPSIHLRSGLPFLRVPIG
ncbi:hypothetical protein TNCV_2210832 [Trichonephila clavipes]|nr:hypothetical protein TNCV_2210832 [Trichonephila clavipes]